MIKNNDKLLIGRDDTSYHVALEDAGLATIDFINNVVENITDITDALDVKITGLESAFTVTDTEIVANPGKNFKVGDDDLFVNVGNNHIGIGTHSPQKSLDVVSNASSNRATVRVQQYSNDNKGPWFNLTKGRGTDTNKQKVQYNDTIGELYFTSWTGQNTTSAIIRCQHSGTDNEGYGRLTFKTRGPDGIQPRLYTQASGEVVITKGLILNTEDTDTEFGTFTMRDYTNSDEPLAVVFTKYRGNNPAAAESSGDAAARSNFDDRLLPGDGVVRFAFGGWNGIGRKNLAQFKVNCVDEDLTGEVRLSTAKVGSAGPTDRIVIDGNGDTHIKNGKLILEQELNINGFDISGLQLSRLSGTNDNVQTQLDDKIKKSDILQIVQDNNNYDDFRTALINLLS